MTSHNVITGDAPLVGLWISTFVKLNRNTMTSLHLRMVVPHSIMSKQNFIDDFFSKIKPHQTNDPKEFCEKFLESKEVNDNVGVEFKRDSKIESQKTNDSNFKRIL